MKKLFVIFTGLALLLTSCEPQDAMDLTHFTQAVNRNKKCSDFGKKNYSGNGNSLCSNFGNNSAVTVVLN